MMMKKTNRIHIPDFVLRVPKKLFLIVFLFSFFQQSIANESFTKSKSGIKTQPVPGADTLFMSLDFFVETICQKDPHFQQILIEQLSLQYDQILALPVKDIVIGLQSELGINLKGEPAHNIDIQLDKLFPMEGQYSRLNLRNHNSSNSIRFEYGAEIARNAFGKVNRFLSSITGFETEVAKYQITEAYEDYLSRQINTYYDWVASYEKLKAAKNSTDEAQQFLENVVRKKRSHIAYQVDVDKAEIQLLSKKDILLEARRDYLEVDALIRNSLDIEANSAIAPDSANWRIQRELEFEQSTEKFFQESRTFTIQQTLMKKDSLQVQLDAHNLMPSAQLYLSLDVDDLPDDPLGNTTLSAGFQVNFPYERSREKARLQVSKINRLKREVTMQNIMKDLRVSLQNLQQNISVQKEMITLKKKQLDLAQSIYKAESKDYLYGRTEINDLIQALNTIQNVKFDLIRQQIQMDILKVEWLRLTDQLVTPKLKESTSIPREP